MERLTISWDSMKYVLSKGYHLFYVEQDEPTNTYKLIVRRGEILFYCNVTGTQEGDSGYEFVTTYKSTADVVGSDGDAVALTTPALSISGAQIVETEPTRGRPGHTSWTINTHLWNDKTTWYQDSRQVVQQTLTGNESYTEYQAQESDRPWINIRHPRLTIQVYSEGGVMKGAWLRDGTRAPLSYYYVHVYVNDVEITSNPDSALVYKIDYPNGRIIFLEALGAEDTVKATFWTPQSSRFCFRPPEGKGWLTKKMELQRTAGANFVLKDTALIRVWLDPYYVYDNPAYCGFENVHQHITQYIDTAQAECFLTQASGGTEEYLPRARNGYGVGYTRGNQYDVETIRWVWDEGPFGLCSQSNMSMTIELDEDIPQEAEHCTLTIWWNEDTLICH